MDTTEILPDEDDRKLFVGGLPQDAKQDDISAHFQTFGEIDNINLKTDPATGRSRGFAFVVFKTVEGLKDAVATEEHAVKVIISNRWKSQCLAGLVAGEESGCEE